MEMVVLDENFKKIYVLDDYESFMWVDRYNKPGEFELYATVTEDLLKYPRTNYYIQFSGSEKTMIIEDYAIESNTESGNHIKIIGRSLESILDRRIVWDQTSFTGNLETGIKRLLYANVIGGNGQPDTPSIVGGNGRKITNFVFEASGDSKIASMQMANQYTGDNLLEVIQQLCEDAKVGFKITLNDNNQFVFKLFTGEDRSYRQSVNPWVVFKPSFGNIISSNYVETNSDYKNVALVAGEGEGSSRTTQTVGTTTGLLRKELYVDARDLRREDVPSGTSYDTALIKRGKEKLSENTVKREFDGKCETSTIYKYGRDFKMGDILQIANEYGIESPAMVTEFIWNHSSTGIDMYPTFTAMEEEGN